MLTDTQVWGFIKLFVNNSSTNIKLLSKAQLSKMAQLGGFLFNSENSFTKELKNNLVSSSKNKVWNIVVDTTLNDAVKKITALGKKN